MGFSFSGGGENDKGEDISVNLVFIISNRTSDTKKGQPVDVMTCICIVYFIDISGYGTYYALLQPCQKPQHIETLCRDL